MVPFLDDVDPFAQLVGSVNTVVRRGDRLVGYNTDADGFRQAVTAGVAASGVDVRAAMVYGYGGVTNVVVHVLKELGYAVALTGRRPEAKPQRARVRRLLWGLRYPIQTNRQFSFHAMRAGVCM